MITKKIKILNKNYKKPLSCLAVYSPGVAKFIDGIVDIILVGDSLGITLYGMKNTQGVTLEMMEKHGLAVTKNVKKSISVIDMPYKSYVNKRQAYTNAKKLLESTKANFVKLEINSKKIPIVKYLSDKKINVMAHIGVTPQSHNDFKKIKVVGRTEHEFNKLILLAKNAELSGAKVLLLECITERLAKNITSSVSIPTIGIGASKNCNGQILVFDDLINLNNENKYKFVKNYMNFNRLSKTAVKKFSNEVKSRKFPGKKNSYK